jgi:Flp pilus assembly protein CpaB
MGAPSRPPRARSSGGRTLMLLGVLLALAAGAIVIYIVSQATGTTAQTVQVVVAAKDIPAGTVLSASDATNGKMLVSDAFVAKPVNTDFAPPDAFTFTSPEDLAVKLNDHVTIADIFSGEILRQNDKRLVELGTTAPGSLTNFNPSALQPNQVLVVMPLTRGTGDASRSFVSTGDLVDILVTECSLPGSKDPTGCETQTTLQNVVVYAAFSSAIVVVLSHQDALTLKYLTETGKVDLALRKPGDNNTIQTTPVDGAYIVKNFHY